MDDAHFAPLRQSRGAAPSRRALTRLLGGLALGMPLALAGRGEAAAGKRRCRSLPCAKACPSVCDFCFIRPGAPTMCGGNLGVGNCDPDFSCTSDADCEQDHPGLPFCVSRYVDRGTGVGGDVCPSPGAFCQSISAC